MIHRRTLSTPRSTRAGRLLRSAACLVAAGLVIGSVAACKPAHGGGAAGAANATLTVAAYDGPTVQRNFNPFSPTGLSTAGVVYQDLFDFSMVNQNKFVPGLATKYEVSKDGRTVTLDIDPRATWSNGDKVTVDDVVFSLDFEKKNGLVAYDFLAAKAIGEHQVQMTFSQPVFVNLQDVGATLIVPKKIWSQQDPTKWTDPDPVGSGPYLMSQFNSQQVTFTARKDYWGAKMPVKKLEYVVTGSLLGQQLLRHEVDVTQAGQPNIKRNFVDKDPKNNHLWPAAMGMHALAFNTARKPFNNVEMRRGLQAALDLQTIADAYNPGMYQPVGPTGLDGTQWAGWVPEQYRAPLKQDTTAALAHFAKAGYHQKNGKLVGPNGKQLSIQLVETGQYTDAMTYDRAAMDQLSKVGINAKVDGVSDNAWNDAADHYDYDVIMLTYRYSANPYRYFNTMLRAKQSTQPTVDHGNYAHWNDPTTEKLLNGLSTAATETEQKAYVNKLDTLMVQQVPVIPLHTRTSPCEYSTFRWTGWPSADNPYAMCFASGTSSERTLVLSKLQPVAKS